MDERYGAPGPGSELPPSKFGAGYTVGDGVNEPPQAYRYPDQYPPPAPEPPAPPVHYPAQEPAAPDAGQVSYPSPPPPQYPVVMMPAGYVPAAKTNGMAIAALVCSLVFSPLGIVFGHIALSQIKRTGEDGRGLAIAGLVVGYIFTAILVVYLIVVIAFLGALGVAINDSTYDSDYYSLAVTSMAG